MLNASQCGGRMSQSRAGGPRAECVARVVGGFVRELKDTRVVSDVGVHLASETHVVAAVVVATGSRPSDERVAARVGATRFAGLAQKRAHASRGFDGIRSEVRLNE